MRSSLFIQDSLERVNVAVSDLPKEKTHTSILNIYWAEVSIVVRSKDR
jgi:hypothetical protein